MLNLTSPKVIKEIIDNYDFNFSKSLGQNFLIDGNIVKKIIDFAEITKDDYVLEIGPGLGGLTQFLCQNAKKVVSVEIDNKLISVLEDNLNYDNLNIINEDILQVDLKKLIEEKLDNKPIKVVGNLPYYLTSPIIMELLQQRLNILNITIMIQKEVAQRIAANPGTKDYGSLSVATQYFCLPKRGFSVSKQCFIPQPKVESTVLKLHLLDKPSVEVKNEQIFFDVVKAAFAQRRKTLINSLANYDKLNLDKSLLKEFLNELGISAKTRGETLTLKQFAELSNKIAEKCDMQKL